MSETTLKYITWVYLKRLYRCTPNSCGLSTRLANFKAQFPEKPAVSRCCSLFGGASFVSTVSTGNLRATWACLNCKFQQEILTYCWKGKLWGKQPKWCKWNEIQGAFCDLNRSDSLIICKSMVIWWRYAEASGSAQKVEAQRATVSGGSQPSVWDLSSQGHMADCGRPMGRV